MLIKSLIKSIFIAHAIEISQVSYTNKQAVLLRQALISNYKYYEVWYAIIYTFPNFNGPTEYSMPR